MITQVVNDSSKEVILSSAHTTSAITNNLMPMKTMNKNQEIASSLTNAAKNYKENNTGLKMKSFMRGTAKSTSQMQKTLMAKKPN